MYNCYRTVIVEKLGGTRKTKPDENVASVCHPWLFYPGKELTRQSFENR